MFYGLLEPNEEVVIEEMARKMLTSPNATIFPGPLLLWAWNDHAVEKAKAAGSRIFLRKVSGLSEASRRSSRG